VPKRANLFFPWRSSSNDVERKLRSGAIPPQLWEAIRQEEPYPTSNLYSGGNDVARALAKLANGKHTVGLSTLLRVVRCGLPTVRGSGSFAQFPNPHWDPERNELVLAIVDPSLTVDQDYKVDLALGLAGPAPITRIPATRLLATFADRAERFTARIEAKCLTS